MPKKKRKRPPSHKQSQKSIQQKLRVTQAIEKLCEGSTYEEIAKELNWNSKQAAWEAVQRYLDEVQAETADNLRKIHNMRLRKMMQVPYLRAQAGDNFAIASVLNIMSREARLNGLDAPTKSEVTGADGAPLTPAGVLVVPKSVMTDDEWEKEMQTSQTALAERERQMAGVKTS